jgi:RNA polymerase sigma-70 factor (ECF subfamily)
MTPAETRAEIERLHAAGFAWAMTCCRRNRERAEDVLQTSYLKILDGRARFGERSTFKTFLFGVIRRTAAEERRRAALASLLGERAGAEARPATGLEAVSADRLALRAALARLPGRQREVLELVFAFGMTLQEAARTLSISPGSASVHYDRGKKRLATLLGERVPA